MTLKLEPGCVLGLLGPNGAGKTTLLRLILGLHRPTAGWAKVFGRTMTPNAADLRRRIGYIPTNPQFPRGMTPITYLDYMARLFGLPAEVRKPRLASLIRAVDLLGGLRRSHRRLLQRHDRPPGRGRQPHQRAGPAHLGRTDARPRPRSAPQHARADQDAGREKTLIVSSHNLSDIDEVCNHAAVLSHGHLIYCGSLQDLKGRMRQSLRAGPRRRSEGDHQGDAGDQGHAGVQRRHSLRRAPRVRLNDDANNAAALANVFMTLADNKVTVISIRSVGQQTEQAFLDLVEKEESKGFTRAYQFGEVQQSVTASEKRRARSNRQQTD